MPVKRSLLHKNKEQQNNLVTQSRSHDALSVTTHQLPVATPKKKKQQADILNALSPTNTVHVPISISPFPPNKLKNLQYRLLFRTRKKPELSLQVKNKNCQMFERCCE